MPERPSPTVVEVAIEPRSHADGERLAVALLRMSATDPHLGVFTDEESGQTILRGLSEEHLEVVLTVLIDEHGVAANIGAPQVAYREMITQRVEIDHTHKFQHGGRGEFARVTLVFEPGESGSGFEFVNACGDESAHEAYVQGVARGLEAVKDHGLVAGFPLVDFKATLGAIYFHDIDSSALAFETAARGAFKKLREQGAPRLIEPIMKVEVLSPDDYVGDVIGDLNQRRGKILSAQDNGDEQLISAFVPLSNMFGYVSNLRGMSESRARFAMTFDHYAETPRAPDDDPGRYPPVAAAKRA